MDAARMLDGHYKSAQDRFWDRVARPLARTSVTPNQLTILGAFLVIGSAVAYLFHGRAWLLGVCIAALEMLDNLDGAVARITGRVSRFGAYLDALTDRYKESAIFFVIAWQRDLWPLAFACVTGSLLTSYAKARAGMETRIDNAAWPDLFERFERMAVLCTGLIVSVWLPTLGGRDTIMLTLVVVAVASHVSALQRLVRARGILERD